jgi:hypothetical protein
MDAGNFLLSKIVGHETNGLSSLGDLNAKHFKDIKIVMEDFAEQAAIELIELLKKGNNVTIGKTTIGIERKGKKK